MTLDLAAVAREAAARWRHDRAILMPLSGLLLFVPQWATLMLVPDQPAMPPAPDQAALQLWAEAVRGWIASYGAIYLGSILLSQFGQLAIVALYVDAGERSTAGGALARAAWALPRFVLAGMVVAMPLLATGLVAISAPTLLVIALPVVVYVLGRTTLIGAALLSRGGTGAVRAVALSWRWTRGAGLPLAMLVGALLITMSVAIQLADLAVAGLRQGGIASPALSAALDAGAAVVAWAAMLMLAMMQAVLYRRLAR